MDTLSLTNSLAANILFVSTFIASELRLDGIGMYFMIWPMSLSRLERSRSVPEADMASCTALRNKVSMVACGLSNGLCRRGARELSVCLIPR